MTNRFGDSLFEDIKPNQFGDRPLEVNVFGDLPIQETPKEVPDRTWGEAGIDLATAWGSGSNSLLKLTGDIYGLTFDDMDNWASKQGARGIEFYQGEKSDKLKTLESNRQLKIDQADGQISKFGVMLWETLKHPIDLGIPLVAEQAPLLLATGGAGAGAGLAAKTGLKKATSMTAEAIAKKSALAATGGAIGTGATMQGADVGAGTYEGLMELKDEVWLLNEEYTDRLAKGEKSEEIKNDIAISTARNTAAAATTTSILTSVFIKNANVLEKKMSGLKLEPKGIFKTALAESSQEVIEETAGKLFSNVGISTIDKDQSLTEGLGQTAATAILPAAVFGGIAGAGGKDKKTTRDIINDIEDTSNAIQNTATVDEAMDIGSAIVGKQVAETVTGAENKEAQRVIDEQQKTIDQQKIIDQQEVVTAQKEVAELNETIDQGEPNVFGDKVISEDVPIDKGEIDLTPKGDQGISETIENTELWKNLTPEEQVKFKEVLTDVTDTGVDEIQKTVGEQVEIKDGPINEIEAPTQEITDLEEVKDAAVDKTSIPERGDQQVRGDPTSDILQPSGDVEQQGVSSTTEPTPSSEQALPMGATESEQVLPLKESKVDKVQTVKDLSKEQKTLKKESFNINEKAQDAFESGDNKLGERLLDSREPIKERIQNIEDEIKSLTAPSTTENSENVFDDLGLKQKDPTKTEVQTPTQGKSKSEKIKVIDKLYQDKNVNNAISFIAENSESELNKEVAKRILPAISDKLDFKLYDTGEKAPAHIARNLATGVYKERFDRETGKTIGDQTIDLAGKTARTPEQIEKTIIHEAIHHTVNEKIRIGNMKRSMTENPKLAKQVKRLYGVGKTVREYLLNNLKEGRNKFFYSTTKTVSEFPTWALTDPDFQEMLKKVPYKKGTAWGAFVDSVSNILGLKTAKDYSALEEIIDITDTLIDTKITKPKKTSKQGKETSFEEVEDNTVGTGFSDWVAPNALLGHISDPLRSVQGIKQRLRSTRRTLQDKEIVWEKIQKAIKEKGGFLNDESDAYNKFTLIQGKVGAKFRSLKEEHIDPIKKGLTDGGITIEQLDKFLMAKFAPSRNSQIATINESFPDGGSGITDQEANDILNSFSVEQIEILEALADKVYAMQDYKLKELLDSGKISQDYYETLKADKYYVPLKGLAEQSDIVTNSQDVGRGFDQASKAFKQALGRKDEAIDIFATSVRDVEAAIVNAQGNLVGGSVLKMVRDNPNDNLWEINPIKITRGFNKRTGQVEQRVSRHYTALLSDPNVFITWEKGKPYAIRFKDNPHGESSLARALKNMGVESVPHYIKYFANLNGFLAYVNTAANAEFIITNPIRDIETALLSAFGNYDASIAVKVLKGIPRAFAGSIGGVDDNAISKKVAQWIPEETQFYKEYEEDGGKTDYFRVKTIEEMKETLNFSLEDIQGGNKAQVKKIFRGILKTLENTNAVLENMTRLSMYTTLRKEKDSNGNDKYSRHQAAVAAKNLTVNFNRKGEAGFLINSMYLFYGASVQGAHLILKLMKIPKVQKLLVGAAAAVAGLTQYNILAGGEDDDGEPNYFKHVTDYEKERNLIFMWPDGSGKYSKVPLGYGLNVPLNAGAALAHVANGKPPIEQASWLISSAWNSVSPLSEDSFLNMIAPTFLDPYVDIGLNKDYAGRDIAPGRNIFEKVPTPSSQMSFRNTPDAYKKAAQYANNLTGGDKRKAGYVDVSPEAIQHLVQSYTGGAGTFVSRVNTWLTDPDMETQHKPIVRKFYGEKSKFMDGARFKENRAHINYLWSTYTDLKLDERNEDIPELKKEKSQYTKEFKSNNKQGLDLMRDLKRADSSIKLSSKLINKGRSDGDDAKVKKYEDKRRELQVKFNKKYNEIYLEKGIASKFLSAFDF